MVDNKTRFGPSFCFVLVFLVLHWKYGQMVGKKKQKNWKMDQWWTNKDQKDQKNTTQWTGKKQKYGPIVDKQSQ